VPNKIGSNVRDLTVQAVVDRLKTITLSAGYNTQPLVSEDFSEAYEADSDYALWVDVGSESQDEKGFTERHMILEILIAGFVKQGEGGLRHRTNKLIQDVRTCIDSYVVSMRGKIGTGTFSGWGVCEVDSGILLPDKRGQFVQPLTITYLQGVTW